MKIVLETAGLKKYYGIKPNITKALDGTTVMYAFHVLIVYANNGNIMASEWAGLAVCLGVVAALSAVIYGGYRLSLGKVCRVLNL